MDSDARADRNRILQLRLTNFLHGASGATMGFNVLFLKTQGLSPATVGIIMGINAIVGAVSPPIWGIFADRIQSKYKIFLYTILGACVVSVLIPVSAAISIGGVILATAMIPFMSFFRMPSQAMIDAVDRQRVHAGKRHGIQQCAVLDVHRVYVDELRLQSACRLVWRGVSVLCLCFVYGASVYEPQNAQTVRCEN